MGLAILVLLLVIIVTVVAGAVRSLLRAWLDHRVRLALLSKLETSPSIVEPDDTEALLLRATAGSPPQNRQDYAVTGASLGVIGATCILLGWGMRVGQIAVGIHLGGVICVCLGFILFLFGMINRRILAAPRS